jgi:hypothetical protein
MMNDADIELGPIDYIVVEWPADRPPTGKAFPLLVDLVDQGVIRVLDFAFVQKEKDGEAFAIALEDVDLDGTPDLMLFRGASSGLLGKDDYDEAAKAVEPGSAAAILVYENTWAAPFATELRRGGAKLVASGRIPVNALIAALDEAEGTDASVETED